MRAILLLRCIDRPGIVGAVGSAIEAVGGNIVAADQHRDERAGGPPVFLQRIEIDVADQPADELRAAVVAPLTDRFELDVEIDVEGEPRRLVVLVSRPGHCLADLLGRDQLGQLSTLAGFGGRIAAVVSDYDDHHELVARLDIPFHHLPVGGHDRAEHDRQVADAVAAHSPDLVVLARYMRILPAWVVERHRGHMINVHHSFLPAFVGAGAYRQAHERGVKVIGATAHYVDVELDEGPIITQRTLAVSHRDDAEALASRGRDVERIVLAEAVRLHLERRVLVDRGRTAIFD